MRLFLACLALTAAQVFHGAAPGAETEGGSAVGFYGGILLLLAALVATVGAAFKARFAARLAVITGSIVAVGFVLYHALPFKSPLTNPYWGESVSAIAWSSVFVSIAAGAWAAYEGRAVENTSDTAVVTAGSTSSASA